MGHGAGPLSPGDPRAILDARPMGALQVAGVGLCFLLNAFDGFDVLAITFAAPGIARAWGIDPAAIGLVISLGLFGMVGGSVFLAPLADRIGRRPLILVSLAIMGTGMAQAAIAPSFAFLAAVRLLTGLGMGAVIAAITAQAAEVANRRRRDLCVALMAVGYPLGGVLGGSVSALLLEGYGWRAIFLFGAAITLLMIPLVLAWLPESVAFLARRGRPGDLARINRTLSRMGHPAASELAPADTDGPKADVRELLRGGLAVSTLALTAMFSLHMAAFYYALGWVPSLVASLGFTQSQGAIVSMFLNMGGVAGGIAFGFLVGLAGLRPVLLAGFVAAGAAVALFGQAPADLALLKAAGFAIGFAANGSVIVFYALLARAYPTALRAAGAGLTVGIGRLGAACGPILAGYLIAADVSRGTVSLILASGSVAAALIFLLVPIRGAREDRPKPPG